MFERLQDKIGPLPVWGWGVLVGAAMIAYLYFTSWRGTNAPQSAASGSQGVASGASVWDAYTGAGGGSSPTQGTPGPDTTAPIASNLQWIAQGQRVAIEKGYPGVTAQIALQRFLAGEQLSALQQEILNVVLAVIGSPPEGTSGTPSLAPVKGETPTPTKTKSVSREPIPPGAPVGSPVPRYLDSNFYN